MDLAAARNAAGLKQTEAALVGLSESAIRNWEKARGEGDWARQFLWLREMARRSPIAAHYVAQIVGLRDEEVPPVEEDAEIGPLVLALRYAQRQGREDVLDLVRKTLEITGMKPSAARPSGS